MKGRSGRRTMWVVGIIMGLVVFSLFLSMLSSPPRAER